MKYTIETDGLNFRIVMESKSEMINKYVMAQDAYGPFKIRTFMTEEGAENFMKEEYGNQAVRVRA